jgi:uncharacterized protein YjaG (DUF416 family)
LYTEALQYLNKIEERLKLLEHWQKICFVACCAETNFPLLKLFAEIVTIEFYENTLNEIWQIILLKPTNIVYEVEHLLDVLDSLPEAYEDDSNSKSYYAMRGLGSLYYVLQMINSNDSKYAKSTSNTSHSNKSGIEFVVLYGEKHTMTIKNEDPPIPMTKWDKKEILFQEEILDLIENNKLPNKELVETLKQKSKTYAHEFAIEVEKYGKLRKFI